MAYQPPHLLLLLLLLVDLVTLQQIIRSTFREMTKQNPMEMKYQSGFWKIISSFGQIMLFWSLDAICETGKVIISMAGETTNLDTRITPCSQIERLSSNPDMEPRTIVLRHDKFHDREIAVLQSMST